MTTFPNSPRLMKAAIVSIDIINQITSVIQFQYNPDTLTRKLQARTPGEGGNKSEALRLQGAPQETITLDIEIDATDQLEKAQSNAVSMGIYPQLSALEILIYPKSSDVIDNSRLLAEGTIEIIPPVAPMTLLSWDPNRVLPVRLTDFTITEEAHDVNLNPIRAKVSLSLRVLSYSDLPVTHPGYNIFMDHQIVKEKMASLGRVNDLSAIGGVSQILE